MSRGAAFRAHLKWQHKSFCNNEAFGVSKLKSGVDASAQKMRTGTWRSELAGLPLTLFLPFNEGEEEEDFLLANARRTTCFRSSSAGSPSSERNSRWWGCERTRLTLTGRQKLSLQTYKTIFVHCRTPLNIHDLRHVLATFLSSIIPSNLSLLMARHVSSSGDAFTEEANSERRNFRSF